MKIFNPTTFNPTTYDQACEWLDNGNLLAYPTEAVWGIGCDPFNEQAVLKLLEIKDRPMEKGLIVITASPTFIQEFLQPLPVKSQRQIIESWQGYPNTSDQATTWLFPIPTDLTKSIPNWVTGGRDNLAIRVINHPNIAELCQVIAKHSPNNPYGFLVSTSCNPSGEAPATTFAQAQAYFGDTIGYFDAPTLGYTQPSQIKDALTGQIVRD
ncbi:MULTISPECIES: L-threonylcarbamoyladenylate synthase [unclassified Moraxella]|uniref:L-threonylcarbamoyladenylate synthase n=1 Tax=unclassified Moraxella TaxID=2685852 RepID=UPI003AF8B8AC